MRPSLLSKLDIKRRWLAYLAVAIGLVGLGAYATRGRWTPPLKARLAAWAKDGDGEGSGGHDHDHGRKEETSIQVSEQGLKNIGFVPWTVELKPFEETVLIPATVVERPGRSQFQITAPLTGSVTRIRVLEGMAVEPHSPMFEIRLTHEEVVVAQRDFLRTAESLDVVNREIIRLQRTNVGGESAIAGKRIIEQEYEKQKLEASLRADRQGLYLHGLNEKQVDDILKNRKLLQSMVVSAPEHVHDDETCPQDHTFHLQKMLVKPGANVQAGQALCVLADHCELFLEGRAFENDAQRLRNAIQRGWEITAIGLAKQSQTHQDQKPTGAGREASPGDEDHAQQRADADDLRGLKLLYLADQVDANTGAFVFYLRLSNELMRAGIAGPAAPAPAAGQKTQDAPRFIDWRYKPGQRFDLRVPIQQWKACLQAPIESVVDEGVESYVFVQNGNKFERRPVHVEYRDRQWAVIAQDGSLFVHDMIAGRGAYQLHLAIKNQSGGGVDPHAGHNH